MQHGAMLRSLVQVVDHRTDLQWLYVTLALDEVISADGVYSPHYVPLPDCCPQGARARANMVTMMGIQLFQPHPGPNLSVGQQTAVRPVENASLTSVHSRGKSSFGTSRITELLDAPSRNWAQAARFSRFMYIYGVDLSPSSPGSQPQSSSALRTTSIFEDWIHPQWCVLLIGSAAHPILMGLLYSLGMAVEDTATLGKQFAHLHTTARISTFLSVVQEIRAAHGEHVGLRGAGPDFARAGGAGEMLSRGMGMHQTSEEMIQSIEGIFAYDREDEVGQRWVKWGLTQECALWIFDSHSFDLTPTRASPSRTTQPKATCPF
ncbi:hypothetical protein C8Q80DRAFT_1265012 [Daedaleopsis nitida]|nr:hypothetical protein C8Q80DRAFT_1275404 [Daedaleopsis nitida]KAI0757025.1 hypothetical protein C8Q80DRAFT_1265012 [Daedaleopsis nitida]